MQKIITLLLSTILYSSLSMAASKPTPKSKGFTFGVKDTYLGLGSYTALPNEVQTDENGGTNGLFDLEPYLLGGLEYQVYGDWSAFIEAAIVKPGSGRDPKISKLTYFTLFSAGYNYRDWTFKLGTGFSMTRISSEGGTQSLNNGTGTTDFPMPDGASVSQNLLTTFGVEYYFHPEISTKLEGQYFNLFSEFGKSLSYTFSFAWHFGNIFEKAKNQGKKK